MLSNYLTHVALTGDAPEYIPSESTCIADVCLSKARHAVYRSPHKNGFVLYRITRYNEGINSENIWCQTLDELHRVIGDALIRSRLFALIGGVRSVDIWG